MINKNIQHLYAIAQKKERLIIGLMSGTSLDGLDVVLCNFRGEGKDTKVKVLNFETVPYSIDFKEELLSVFSKQQVDLAKLCLLNGWIGEQHGRIINECLQKWGIEKEEIDLIASHGQTIYHAPKRLHQLEKFGNATLQIGDGDHLAVTTGIITVSDFRQKHIASGGEGAPLAVYADYLLFSHATENRVLLNIGGIANFTYLPARGSLKHIICTDIGAGNTMMDACVRNNFNHQFYDKDALIARSGNVNNALLIELKAHDFFRQSFPKTTGPELFNLSYLDKAIKAANINAINYKDVMATLNKFTADMIVDALQRTINRKENIVVYASGGGIHNPLLMEHLNAGLPNVQFNDFNTLGINPDAKEAVLFAVLANETMAGKPSKQNSLHGLPQVSMGKISFPD